MTKRRDPGMVAASTGDFELRNRRGRQHFDVYDKSGKLVKQRATLKEASDHANLDPHEVAWAYENSGRADTDDHQIVPHKGKFRG